MSDTDDVVLEPEDGEGNTGTGANKLKDLREELKEVKKQRDEYLESLQRMKADYVNARKRFEEEKSKLIEFGKLSSAEAFIPALDSLAHAEEAGTVPDTFQGIAKQLHDAMKSLGLTSFGEVGDMFDPVLHEALSEDAVTSLELDSTITAVLQKGWKTEKTVISPAKVRVGSYKK